MRSYRITITDRFNGRLRSNDFSHRHANFMDMQPNDVVVVEAAGWVWDSGFESSYS